MALLYVIYNSFVKQRTYSLDHESFDRTFSRRIRATYWVQWKDPSTRKYEDEIDYMMDWLRENSHKGPDILDHMNRCITVTKR